MHAGMHHVAAARAWQKVSATLADLLRIYMCQYSMLQLPQSHMCMYYSIKLQMHAMHTGLAAASGRTPFFEGGIEASVRSTIQEQQQ